MSDEQIAAELSRYNAQLTEIRGDQTLSDLGKQQKIAEVYERTRDKVKALRGDQSEDTGERVAELHRELFGLGRNPSGLNVIAHRDAVERVSSVKRPEQLANLMERAHSTGDQGLLKAGFELAWRKSREALASEDWQALVDEYLKHNPGDAAHAKELAKLTDPKQKTERFMRNLTQSVIKPRELTQARKPSNTKPAPRESNNLIR